MRSPAPLRVVAVTGALLGGLAALGAHAQPDAIPTGGAEIDRASFDHQRWIPAGAPGASSLRLDLEALAHSHLDDVRLVTGDGHQVPYLLDQDDPPLRVGLPSLVRVAEPEIAARLSQGQGRARTVYAIAFPVVGLPASVLVLETSARVFEREVSVLVRDDDPRERGSGRWRTRAWGSWRHADPDVPAPPLTLPLPALRAPSGRVVVDEGDNRALPITRATLELRTYRLRFWRDTEAGLWLVYGRSGLTAPRYDLALLQSRLRTGRANDVSADPEPPSVRPGVATSSRIVFWGALVAAVIALLALLARLLRTQPGQ